MDLNDIEHQKTKARNSPANGHTERFNQTLLDEFLNEYNFNRTNHGKYCNGRTPMETFKDGLDLCRQYLQGDK
jgi:transposase InsO family protein